MSEQTKTLGAGALALPYTAGDPTIRVSPAAWPAGVPFSNAPTFSIAIKSGAGPAYPVYTVSVVVATIGGDFTLTLALEAGTDQDAAAGTLVIEVQSTRSLAALLAQSHAPGGSSGDVQLNNGAGGFSGTPVLAVSKGGSGSSSPSLGAGSGIGISGTWPDQTITNTGGGGSGSGIPAISILPPAVASFNWINQGFATAVDVTVDGSPAGVALDSVVSHAAVDANLMTKPRVGSSLVVGLMGSLQIAQFLAVGGVVRDSGSGAFIAARLISGGAYDFQLQFKLYNSPTSEGATLSTKFYFVPNGSPLFVRFVDVAGVVTGEVSLDLGRSFVAAMPGTAFVFDEVGYFISSAFSVTNASGTIFHFDN